MVMSSGNQRSFIYLIVSIFLKIGANPREGMTDVIGVVNYCNLNNGIMKNNKSIGQFSGKTLQSDLCEKKKVLVMIQGLFGL